MSYSVIQSVQSVVASAIGKPLLWLPGVICLYLAYILCYAIYAVTLHPLAPYKGPILWTTTRIPHTYHVLKGTLPFKNVELHKKYGAVIRIGPNELSYIREDAWKDICGHKPGGTELIKDGTTFAPPPGTAYGIISTPSTKDHQRMRRNLNHGFSDKALRDQEPKIMKYVGLLVDRLHDHSKDGPVDISTWYNFTTFDVIGELAFGESFSMLETSEWNEWVKMIIPGAKATVFFGVAKKFPPFESIVNFLIPKSLKEKKAWHRKYATEKLSRRLARHDAPPDFLSYASKFIDTPDGFRSAEINATSDSLTIAGSDTTATLLTAATFLLLKNPSKLALLTKEIRAAFRDDSQITLSSVSTLKYEGAVIEEALRYFPPVAATSPRMTPAAGAMICGRFVPPGTAVGVAPWPAYHSSLNFQDPDEFVPERWLGHPRYADDKRGVCQPFSVGPRNCIGRNLAYAEMRVILAKVIWNFDLELCGESENWMDSLRVYFIWLKDPLMVKLTPVKR